MKQLVAADHRDAIGYQAKASLELSDAKMQLPGGGQLRLAEDLFEPFVLGRGRRNDEDVLTGRGGVQLVAHFVDVAAEPLDRFDPQVAGGFHRADGHGGQRDRRKAVDLCQRRVEAVRVLRTFQPLEKVLPFLLDVGRLDQREPTVRGQVTGEMFAIVVARSKCRHVDRLQARQAALRGDLEAPQRLDFISEKLDAHRCLPVGSKNVQDPAPAGELARQLYGARGMKAVLDEPGH